MSDSLCAVWNFTRPPGVGSLSSITVHAVVQFAHGKLPSGKPRFPPYAKTRSMEFAHSGMSLSHPYSSKGSRGKPFITSRANVPMPFLCAIPCLLYTFTRNKPELGESSL